MLGGLSVVTMGDRRLASMLIALILPALLTGLAPNHGVRAQSDTALVEHAAATYAARHLLDRFPKGRIAFDSLRGSGRPRSRAQSVALTRVLKADGITTERSIIFCSSGPSSCRMSYYVGLVGVQLDDLTDSTAQATVTMRWPSGLPRAPISAYDQSLVFVRRGGSWEFARLGRARNN